MSQTTQKLVLSLDDETQTYKPVAHNLSVEQAVECVDKLQADGITAAIVAQKRQHRSLSFHQCKPCKQAADEFSLRLTQALNEPPDGELVPVLGAGKSADE